MNEAKIIRTGHGEQFEVLEHTPDVLRIRTTLAPDAVRRPLHIHPNQQERFVVVTGRLGLLVGRGAWRTLVQGNEVSIEPGEAHTIWNAGTEPAVVVTEHQPSMRFVAFLREIAALDARGVPLTNEGVPRNILQAAALIDAFSDVMRPVSPPVAVQRILFPPLAWLNRRFSP